MTKKIIISLVIGFWISGYCYAESIYFKSGKKIEGQIVEKADRYVKVNVKGVTITYYNDEIERIENTAMPAPVVFRPASTPALKEIAAKEVIAPTPTPQSGNSSASGVDLSGLSKRELILDFIDISGAKENMSQMFGEIITNAGPQAAEQLKDLFNITEILAHLIPVYDKYFTEEELRELSMFYRSPLGRKLQMVTPLIVEDSMKAAMTYFQSKIPPTPQAPPAAPVQP